MISMQIDPIRTVAGYGICPVDKTIASISGDNDISNRDFTEWRVFMISGKMFLLTMTSIVFLLGTSLASVVINEVEQDPAGEEDAFKASVTAWFELFNNDNKDVDIGGWSINNSVGKLDDLSQRNNSQSHRLLCAGCASQNGWLTAARF